MTTKKKLIALALCVVILVATILSGTVAYFTDEHTVSNTFTSGDVEITLDEGKVTLDSLNRVTVDTDVRVSSNQSYGTLYPAQSFTKDPKITNVSTEAAYIAAKVVVSDGAGDLTNVISDGNGGINIEALLSGGLLKDYDVTVDKADVKTALDTNGYAIYQEVNASAGKYTFYFFIKEAVAKNGTVTLFDTFSVPAAWDNEQMVELKELKIDVTAYGVQTFGFDTSLKALEAAFPDDFSGFVPVVTP